MAFTEKAPSHVPSRQEIKKILAEIAITGKIPNIDSLSDRELEVLSSIEGFVRNPNKAPVITEEEELSRHIEDEKKFAGLIQKFFKGPNEETQ